MQSRATPEAAALLKHKGPSLRGDGHQASTRSSFGQASESFPAATGMKNSHRQSRILYGSPIGAAVMGHWRRTETCNVIEDHDSTNELRPSHSWKLDVGDQTSPQATSLWSPEPESG